jgi:hypothetical protein
MIWNTSPTVAAKSKAAQLTTEY